MCDGNRHPVECRRAPSHTHKLRKKKHTSRKQKTLLNESPQALDWGAPRWVTCIQNVEILRESFQMFKTLGSIDK